MVATKTKSLTKSFKRGFSDYDDKSVTLMLPILTVSEANGGARKMNAATGKARGEYWTEKAKRHKQQKGIVALYLNSHKSALSLPCLITLTRYAPHKLDKHDNLPMSMKWILDAICAIITGDFRPGRADDSDQIDVIYRQEISAEYGVGVKIESN